MDIWIATSNKGKLIEYKTLLESKGINVHSPLELNVYTPPPETGKTFVENARIKARSLKFLKKEQWVLGEDSGLEVEGLNNFPGIHSARYAGPKASDMENIAKLMKMLSLRSANMRKCRFVCAIVAYAPSGEEFIFEGFLPGEISRKVAGTSGFGYDPVFVPEGETKTLAELGAAYKNTRSHRAQAVRKLLEKLTNL